MLSVHVTGNRMTIRVVDEASKSAEPTPIRVYIAGAANEAERVTLFAECAKMCANITTTLEWWDFTLDAERASPTRQQRVQQALARLEGVRACEVLLLLVPDFGNDGFEAFFEADRALSQGKHVVWVGDTERSIFSSLCAYTCATGKEAVDYLGSLAETYATPAVRP